MNTKNAGRLLFGLSAISGKYNNPNPHHTRLVVCLPTIYQEFFFLEVNTRIQVEHGITELTHPGVDLVKWMVCQAHPATPLHLSSFVQKMARAGHAIELRICAEDPTKDFQPSSGVIGEFSLPVGAKGARFETWVYRGCEITPSFDSLILKVLQWAPSRSESIRFPRRPSICFVLRF
jgi:urea carboxylase